MQTIVNYRQYIYHIMQIVARFFFYLIEKDTNTYLHIFFILIENNIYDYLSPLSKACVGDIIIKIIKLKRYIV